MKKASMMPSVLFWVLFLIIVTMNGRKECGVRGDDTQTEALIDLYLATNGPEWFVNENWLDGDACENSWYGVSCETNSTDVLVLALVYNNLRGTLPSSLGTDLPFLRTLQLPSNALFGSIPSLGEELEGLDLSSNNLNGTISSSLVSLESLEFLNLRNNLFTGEIPEFPLSGSLMDFDFGNNFLNGTIPSSLANNLGNLTGITLDSNSLTGSIPNDFDGLATLSLQHNFLTGQVPELRSSQNINLLDLSFNRLTGEVPDYGIWMQSVSQMYLNDNSLSGSIPTNKLQVSKLYLQTNRLTGQIPQWLCGGPEFDISNNNFDCDERPRCCKRGSIEENCGNCAGSNLGTKVFPLFSWWWLSFVVIIGVLVVVVLVLLLLAYRKRLGLSQRAVSDQYDLIPSSQEEGMS
mmetsp:Transcript_19712/g.27201  ORF Transcript_19712/g.27201 Transcript_19712/m.27201 type:complete len:406 (+) Transcript_19712:140-1357(+)|eukprot:CAMPEP_0201475814 /NCGR_PEP_ID=MMETSP0151_2-20130828/1171_1 /ASSEMBLY_ACC=CAM_ASM_000257 /TAXON_ID=200890 /ORGANISM="Paramoeba atlantica, Strain 621/1 / CCAP 1560/9" /LENGTH=405 /DNA_ID=CAMNT_0047856013 /DNA_START=114 /DNA_END=1331 /DNA_ORIENTATION=-